MCTKSAENSPEQAIRYGLNIINQAFAYSHHMIEKSVRYAEAESNKARILTSLYRDKPEERNKGIIEG